MAPKRKRPGLLRRKEAKEKWTKEILPYLREEIERIKKRLREFRFEREKEDQPERIRT